MLLDNQRKISCHLIVKSTTLNEFYYAHRDKGELTDGEVATPFGYIGTVNDIDSGAVRQCGINDRLTEGHRMLDSLCQLNDELIQLTVVFKAGACS